MGERPLFICECGSNTLAVSHTWQARTRYEEVATVARNGTFAFDEKVVLAEEDGDHEWVAYCGGCGHGVTVEWLDERRLKLLLNAG